MISLQKECEIKKFARGECKKNMAEEKKNMRVTAILGAGVNLEYFDRSEKTPTTANITKAVVNTSEYIYHDGSKGKIPELIKNVYLHLCATNPSGALNPDKSYGEVHFEKIFHILEMLYSYDKIWTKGYNNSSVPLFAHFATPNFAYNPNQIRASLDWMVVLIMDFVEHYNEYFAKHKETECKWYFDFWNKAPFKWDAVNFNYDTTIEDSLPSFEDGYEGIENYPDFQRFNPNKLLRSEGHTVNHIHGCILYGHHRLKIEEENKHYIYNYDSHDWYKWRNYALSKQVWLGTGTDVPNAQNGDSIYPSPIITGLNKADKILLLPFSIYRYNLSQKLFQNNAIIIAGYSFGDYYVNYELERMRLYHGDKLRVVLIDFWSMSDYKDVPIPDMIKAYIEFNEQDGISVHKAHFISKVMQSSHLDYYKDHFNTLTHDNYLISENNQLMLFVGGWKNALKYQDEIYKFLQS